MSIAVVSGNLSASPTWRQFQSACVWVACTIGAGCVLYAIETLLLHCERRFVENPADTMTRAIGLAHFSIGWLFLLTSPRLRNRVALTRLTFWTLFGVAFCALFAWGGANDNPLALLAFYSFFFIHEAYDEAYLFRTSGELRERGPDAERFLAALSRGVSLLFILLLAGSQLLRGHFLGRSAELRELPMVWLFAGLGVLAAFTTLAVMRAVRVARESHGSVREAILLYQPLLAVYAGLMGIMLIGSMFGSIGANLVIMLHGMTWLVGTQRKLAAQNVEVRGPWSWLRGSPAGFLTLHLAVTALALTLFALRSHVWERTGLVCDLVSKTWFPYWGIMHIATSFWRK